GCGLMGSGIAQVVAAAGFPTMVVEATQELYERGLGNIKSRLEHSAKKGVLSADECSAIQGRLQATTDKSLLADCDLIIEAIIESLEEKNKVWRALDPILKRDAILASNTSSVPITEMMVATSRPERFIGMHFMNPVPVMPLVEMIRTIATDPAVFETA